MHGEFNDITEGKLKRAQAWKEAVEYCISVGSHINTKKKLEDNVKYWKTALNKKLEDAKHTGAGRREPLTESERLLQSIYPSTATFVSYH